MIYKFLAKKRSTVFFLQNVYIPKIILIHMIKTVSLSYPQNWMMYYFISENLTSLKNTCVNTGLQHFFLLITNTIIKLSILMVGQCLRC